ncbi:phage major capsid protein [Bifidobacterium amazonense]|uniref:Phage major capsid protein n=1 Tax=Bifidobacterium amazonense TaxID=2809027 RepID=A0ABS9VWC4_9BIFI|nr:phage major capsid protein [Bifidobacterium amazonense]MCH9276417.1 phage major capsid protein [Bifidobacterium amazonense]
MTTTTRTAATSFNPDSIVPATEAVPDALALDDRICTIGPTIEGDAPAVRLPYVAIAPAATITTEGREIPESTPGLSELVVRTVKVGLLTEVSREAYSYAQASASITDSARRSVTYKLDEILVAKKTTTNGTPGLAHLHGISETTATDYGLDPILDVIAKVADAGASPTAIILNFSTWAKLLQVKGTDGRGIIAPEVANAPAPQLFGIPVIINAATPADTVLVVDRGTIITSLGDVHADVADGDAFRRDSLQIRLTCRIGWGTFQPAQIGKVTFNTTGK